MTDPLTAAAESNRRRILQLLASQPRIVSEIAAEFPVTRSAISQHLPVLADAGLVEAEKAGRQRIYRVLPSGLRKLQAEIDRFWTDVSPGLIDLGRPSDPNRSFLRHRANPRPIKKLLNL